MAFSKWVFSQIKYNVFPRKFRRKCMSCWRPYFRRCYCCCWRPCRWWHHHVGVSAVTGARQSLASPLLLATLILLLSIPHFLISLTMLPSLLLLVSINITHQISDFRTTSLGMIIFCFRNIGCQLALLPLAQTVYFVTCTLICKHIYCKFTIYVSQPDNQEKRNRNIALPAPAPNTNTN